ncbi:MAG: hypothetical protein UU81_C0002G0016 [Microgenomates group bacterium GW2011_GWC1_41_8]|uniref:Uncharacterized protein n=2 Tax=Candidatus Roizmaniibacteriota TaxID=1752723 RepID=A0A0G0T3A1_9BACT|nr:MAG: hypothetical protein UU14_C0025G0020 [Candidatus Roizmanbacteria bacterium GW2011_GWB1_40_7]KKR94229.1 MAG: hypothetical protein UU41_C0010G0016 [Candidatus Roizmanbacteria bacterium GW2011_GWA1_41_13]KKS24761.1 MAG: hypothetical protein UU81_C0002G0016 [Microgenomates group bacterium GW2011_GWC1_41_8]OGK48493.1 MAG: hypothetical protein A3A55_04710 [Candidatus Roizmanbacteria bacterium RIFCSPLOWO2_01_FULL_40_14]
MKIQDIAFFTVLAGLLILRKPRLAVLLGLIAILLSLPLFHLKIALFTAQRLIQYAAAFFLISCLIQLTSSKLDHYNSL